MARIAQERLASLEKEKASFDSQIEQAAVFSKCPLSKSQSEPNSRGRTEKYKSIPTSREVLHGRQEWTLRWLLKKLQLEHDARMCPLSWTLLSNLFTCMPLTNLSRALKERKFLNLFTQTLEEASREQQDWETEGRNRSRKRTYSGQVVSKTYIPERTKHNHLIESLLDAIITLVRSSELQGSTRSNENGRALAAEYMKSVIRTTSQEAAQMFGAWLDNLKDLKSDETLIDDSAMLGPFVYIWSSRVSGLEDERHFSKYCLRSALDLLCNSEISSKCIAELEELLARNILVPARSTYISSQNMNMFTDLVDEAIRYKPQGGPVILSIAARCLRRQPSGRYNAQDASWLRHVFIALKDAILIDSHQEMHESIQRLLKCCIDEQVSLDVQILRSIVTEIGFSSDNGLDRAILSLVIELDAEVFLMPDNDVMLDDLLSRITTASIKTSWPKLAEDIVDGILTPLLDKFAKTRSLLRFLRHWHAQMIQFETLRQTHWPKNAESLLAYTGAWEDDGLQLKLREVMEASLTTQQIVEVIEWLESEFQTSTEATVVLLDAVTRAVSQLVIAEVIGERVHRLMTSNINWEHLGGPGARYLLRRLRILTRLLKWPLSVSLRPIGLQESDLIIDIPNNLHELELFRFMCAILTSTAGVCIERDVTRAQFCLKILDNEQFEPENLDRLLGKDSLNETWSQKVPSEPGMGWKICAEAHSLLVEYPKMLELYALTFKTAFSYKTNLDDPVLRSFERAILKDVSTSSKYLELEAETLSFLKHYIWMASASTPYSSLHSSSPWLRLNFDAFPSFWDSLAKNIEILDGKMIAEIISLMLQCGNHIDNPLERSRACNGFVVQFLNKMPVEILSRQHRQLILSSWMPESPDPSFNDKGALAFKMTPLDPEILGLKLRIMDRAPMLYEGAEFEDLIHLAEASMTYVAEPRATLKIIRELARATIRHVVSTIDQPKSLKYFRRALESCNTEIVEKYAKSIDRTRSICPASLILVFELLFSVSKQAVERFDTVGLLEEWKVKLRDMQSFLIMNIKALLDHESFENEDNGPSMALFSTLEALDNIGVSNRDLKALQDQITDKINLLVQQNLTLARRMEIFLIQHLSVGAQDQPLDVLSGSVSSKEERLALIKKVQIAASKMTEMDKLLLASNVLKDDFTVGNKLDSLLALRTLLRSCEDARGTPTDGIGDQPTLSTVYTGLASILRKVPEVHHFCLLSEIMEDVLREKSHSLTQFNVDTTLSTITILCSSKGPSLPPAFAGTIFSHLCSLLNAVLAAHRLKLQGHYHLFVQVLQSLLRCLFVPVSFSFSDASKPTKSSSSLPPWLLSITPNPSHHLQPHHAELFTRLLTQVCDPTVSAVTQYNKQANSRTGTGAIPLTSATAKAKRVAAQHMPLILATYIRLRLDMGLKMSAEIREKLTPGIYAIFDTMNTEGRKVLGESLDAAGRAILVDLVRDWSRFGRWKGL